MVGVIINQNGFKVDFDTLTKEGIPETHILKDDESVVTHDWVVANSMNKPKSDGEKWVETEPFPEEEPVIPEPTFEELQVEYNVDLDYRLSIIEMGL